MRKRNRRTFFKLAILLAVVIIPFWLGREFAVPAVLKSWISVDFGYNLLASLVLPLDFFQILGWLSVTLTGLFFADIVVVDLFKHNKIWCLVSFGWVQFFSGLAFLRQDFQTRNLVVYLDQSPKADALDYGLSAGVIGFLFYIVVFILVMIISRKNLQWSFRSKPTLLYVLACEVLVLIVQAIGPINWFIDWVL